ncbi:MAG: sensor histidine kinase [Bacteroidia bacterium]|nr:sensor histidine kinase [Bacteroidia bacterium]
MKNNLTSIIIFILFYFSSYADFDKNLFVKKFNQADYREKIRMVANADFNDIKDIYPLLKDSLEKIKKMVYTRTESMEAKFLFDIIEANLASHQKQFSKCVYIINNCLQYHCNNINDSLRAFLILKECLININDYPKALEIHKIIEKNWNRKSIALWMGTPKSTIYSYLGIYKYAIAERIKEFESGSQDHWEKARLYNDIGVFYNRMKNYDSAEVNFNRALKELSKVDPKKSGIDTNYYNFFISLIKSNLAVGFIKNKKYKEAIPYLLIDVRNSLKNKEYESAFNAYIGLIEIYLNLNQIALAKKYLDTLDILDIGVFSYPNNLAKKYYWQSVYYEKLGNLNKSLDYLKQYLKLSDSIRELDRELQTINTEIAFNVQEKDNAIKEKNAAITILKIKEEKNKSIKIYLIIFIIILLSAGFILYKYYMEAKKHSEELEKNNQTIQQQNRMIQKTLQEKELLIKEIHHRVKNNLQIINSIIQLQISKEKNDKVQTLLSEISARIQSIALTHQMLYKKDKLLKINATEYLKYLCEQIFKSFSDGSDDIHLEFYFNEDKPSDLLLDTAIPLGLICSEVITNAIKYAFPNKSGKITINYTCKDNIHTLIIKDNGIGIDLKKINKTDSLGMELIKLLSEQIDAQYSFKVDHGTIFEISFKDNSL